MSIIWNFYYDFHFLFVYLLLLNAGEDGGTVSPLWTIRLCLMHSPVHPVILSSVKWRNPFNWMSLRNSLNGSRTNTDLTIHHQVIWYLLAGAEENATKRRMEMTKAAARVRKTRKPSEILHSSYGFAFLVPLPFKYSEKYGKNVWWKAMLLTIFKIINTINIIIINIIGRNGLWKWRCHCDGDARVKEERNGW